jgi:hypothetical protein
MVGLDTDSLASLCDQGTVLRRSFQDRFVRTRFETPEGLSPSCVSIHAASAERDSSITALMRCYQSVADIYRVQADTCRIAVEIFRLAWDVKHGAEYDKATVRVITRRSPWL